MIYSSIINKALKFVYKAHEGVVDQGGIPYVFHPLAVAEQMDDENSTLLALLHDVVEDTNYTFDDIRALGVCDEVVNALRLMTRNKTEFYFDYIDRIKTNPLAVKVKLADLNHNSDLSRTDKVTEYDLKRLKKYNKAKEILTSDEEIVFFDDVDVPDEKLTFSVVLAKYNGKYVFVRKDKTIKRPLKLREVNETILETAKKMLYIEMGAKDFAIKEICVFKLLNDNTYGVLYIAKIKEFDANFSENEIEKVDFFDKLPNELSYLRILPKLIERTIKG